MMRDGLLCGSILLGTTVELHGCLSDVLSCRNLRDDDDTEKLFDLLMGTVPHLDEPTLFLKEEVASAQSSADARSNAAAPAGLPNPAEKTQVREKTSRQYEWLGPLKAAPFGATNGVFASKLLTTFSPQLMYAFLTCISSNARMKFLVLASSVSAVVRHLSALPENESRPCS